MPGERSFGLLADIQQFLLGRERPTQNELGQIQWHMPELRPYERDRYFSELFLLLGDDLVSLRSALNENRDAVEKFDVSSRRLTRWLLPADNSACLPDCCDCGIHDAVLLQEIAVIAR
jgi:hypothetical protein